MWHSKQGANQVSKSAKVEKAAADKKQGNKVEKQQQARSKAGTNQTRSSLPGTAVFAELALSSKGAVSGITCECASVCVCVNAGTCSVNSVCSGYI